MIVLALAGTLLLTGNPSPDSYEGLVARGLESLEIAERTFVSERTAKRMVASLLRKLGVANRVEAALLAGRVGLLDEQDATADEKA